MILIGRGGQVTRHLRLPARKMIIQLAQRLDSISTQKHRHFPTKLPYWSRNSFLRRPGDCAPIFGTTCGEMTLVHSISMPRPGPRWARSYGPKVGPICPGTGLWLRLISSLLPILSSYLRALLVLRTKVTSLSMTSILQQEHAEVYI
ncbi:uncharacterized protein LOC115924761 [Strongylocentrotus purpuratus]|uniref:Uncharacterized protein n=1 Tax=Strongylocentrotus purpuratus TaxID=7668 RepID=A0A7M7SZT2_STRPU|nr:uncharacterized protein LOC115924761 [Strongylocentrotus purpuratus]